MKNKVKKISVIVIASLFVLIGGYVCKATTVNFDITVNQNVMNKDPFSRRTQKSDQENNFYVTPTYFSCPGSIKVRSVRCANINQCSNWAYIYSNNVDVVTINPYGCSVYSNENYYMQSMYASGVTSQINVQGRYTP